MQSAPHWENIYSTKAIHDVSWFQKHARCSLDLIGRTQISPDARIIDVGSGASILISELITRGYKNLTVLDISSAAIAAAQKQLGPAATAEGFHLIGGTAVAIHLGHRQSVDFDW
ncbi:MAG: hypothetical protein EBU33_01940, partial [Sphingobacteriia bacterium]|nr:hypothetical protein [Sphingobacteriia bacterium]